MFILSRPHCVAGTTLPQTVVFRLRFVVSQNFRGSVSASDALLIWGDESGKSRSVAMNERREKERRRERRERSEEIEAKQLSFDLVSPEKLPLPSAIGLVCLTRVAPVGDLLLYRSENLMQV